MLHRPSPAPKLEPGTQNEFKAPTCGPAPQQCKASENLGSCRRGGEGQVGRGRGQAEAIGLLHLRGKAMEARHTARKAVISSGVL